MGCRKYDSPLLYFYYIFIMVYIHMTDVPLRLFEAARGATRKMYLPLFVS